MNKTGINQTPQIALTIDLEYWWCSEFLKHLKSYHFRDIIEEATDVLLEELNTYGRNATFFILGEVAQKYKHVVKKIHSEGHEIANHGTFHFNVFESTPKKFISDIKNSTEILENITGESVIGYRAPNFSVTKKTSWIYPILFHLGYRYSSSVFPFKTKLYGIPDAPLTPFIPFAVKKLLRTSTDTFIEFPASVFRIWGKNIPVSGGFYFRVLPFRMTRYCLSKIAERRPATFYIHLRDIYRDVPRLKNIPLPAKFFHYYGVRKAGTKFESLLKFFPFQTVKSVLDLDNR